MYSLGWGSVFVNLREIAHNFLSRLFQNEFLNYGGYFFGYRLPIILYFQKYQMQGLISHRFRHSNPKLLGENSTYGPSLLPNLMSFVNYNPALPLACLNQLSRLISHSWERQNSLSQVLRIPGLYSESS